jgi:uncharacterized membrane protein YhiD involved in acid resistance
MATAAGFYVGAIATTVLALVTLAALRRLKPVVRRRLAGEKIRLELSLVPDASTRVLLEELRRRDLKVEGLESEVLDDGSERVQLDVRGPASLDFASILSALSKLDAVARIDLAVLHALDQDAEDEGPTRTDDRTDRLAFPSRR